MHEKERIRECFYLYSCLKKQWLRLYTVLPDGTRIEWIQ